MLRGLGPVSLWRTPVTANQPRVVWKSAHGKCAGCQGLCCIVALPLRCLYWMTVAAGALEVIKFDLSILLYIGIELLYSLLKSQLQSRKEQITRKAKPSQGFAE